MLIKHQLLILGNVNGQCLLVDTTESPQSFSMYKHRIKQSHLTCCSAVAAGKGLFFHATVLYYHINTQNGTF